MHPPGSPMAASSRWAPRSATRPRSSTPAARSGYASCARSSTWSRVRDRSGRDRGWAVRIGVLGGTFNPPHLGHLICAQEAYLQLGLDRVTLIPARIPPHKTVEDDPGPEHRLELCRLAIRGDEERFDVCDLEIVRDGPSYTVDTLEELHSRAPDHELFLIVGGDIAAGLPSWHRPE